MFRRFSITKKFVLAFLVLSIIPLCALGISTLRSQREIGQRAIDSSTVQLEKRAKEALELRAIDLANRVSQFLQSCEADVLTLAMLPRNAETYRRFSLNHRRTIWTREGTNEEYVEVHKELPSYREAAFIGPNGMEEVRVVDDQIVDRSKLRDVSKPENTTYKCERYFQESKSLKAGNIYVSRVTGWFVSREEQLQGVARVENAIEGKKYEGVIRIATPCFGSKGEFQGIVMLSLDHRHLMELTLHVVPTEERFVVFPSYSSGNYAFMFDDEGWIISHPKFYDIRGILPDGTEFDPAGPSYTKERLLNGEAPFNLDHTHFINENYPFIANEVRQGRSGVTRTFNVGGSPRVMAFAPIPYNRPPYDTYGVFGGITIGVQASKFREPAVWTSAKIDQMVSQTKRTSLTILAVTALLAVSLGIVLARRFTNPILYLSQKAQDIAEGRIPYYVMVRTGDEVELLAKNFDHMATEIRRHRESLEQSLSELAESKKSVEQYSQQLEKQVRVLKNVHSLSQYLSSVYNRELVLQKVLRTCVQGLAFDRAILYLYDPESRRLVCYNTSGFSSEQAAKATGPSYHIDRHECIPTRVFQSGETIFVADIDSDERVSPIDRKIAKDGETSFFVFTPVKTHDRVIGVLGADTKTSRREISKTDIESLEILANDAARSIERSELHGQLVAERNLIKSVVTHMTSGIVTLNEAGIVTWFNPYCENVFKIKPEDALGRHYREVFAGLPAWIDVVDRYLDSRPADEPALEQHSIFQDGEEKILEVQFSRIRQEKQGASIFLLFVRDITRRKLMEEHLRRSDRLVSIGFLAAGIAHEIRNPLTGISLLMDDLHDHLYEHPEERKLIRKSLDEIDRLENLVNGLLDFAVPSRGVKLEVRPLHNVLENTLFLVRKLCKNQNITLAVLRAESLPLLNLDPEKLQQALLNLIRNAIQAMPEGGSLRIEVKRVGAEESLLSREAVRILVADTGVGIAPEDVPYIFDPFFTRNPSGFGLGLAIVHSIVQEHEGRMSVSSQQNKGTTIWMDLPTVQNSSSAHEETTQHEPNHSEAHGS